VCVVGNERQLRGLTLSSCRSSSNAAVPVGTFDALHLQRATARRAVDMERHGGGRRVLGNPAAAERLVAFVAHACKGRFSILPIELCIRSQSAAFSIAIVFVSPACIGSSRFADTAKFVAACHCLSCLPKLRLLHIQVDKSILYEGTLLRKS
jgi:hypothetical protein